jgi:hypothetical protein
MNANYGYQLYQAERTQTRAEILAGDARRGRWAQASRRWRRSPARKGPRSRDHGHHRGPDGSRRVIMTGPTRGGTA